MHLFRSVIKSSFYSLMILFVIVVSLLIFLLTTTPGLFLSVKLANAVLPGKLLVEGVHGQVIDHISFDKFLYSTSDMQIEMVDGTLRWRMQDLLRHQLTIKKLDVDELTLVFNEHKQPVSETPALAFPKLPVTISIKKAMIKKITITTPSSKEQLTSLQLSAKLTPTQWEISQLNLLYRTESIQLMGLVEPTMPYQLHAILQVKPTLKKKPFVKGNLIVKGNFVRYQWTGSLKSPTLLTSTGTLAQGKTLHTLTKWKNFDWPINPTEHVSSDKGQLAIDGTWPNLLLNLDTNLTSPLPSTIKASASTNLNTVEINAKAAASMGYLDFHALYNPANLPSFGGTLIGQTHDEQIVSPLKQGKINAEFKGDNLSNLSILSQITAQYFEQSFSAAFDYQRQQLKASVNLGPNKVKLTGPITFPLKLTATIPEPALLHPSLSGLKTRLTAKAILENEQQGHLTLNMAKGSFKLPEMSELPFEGGSLEAALNTNQLLTTGDFSLDVNKKIKLKIGLPQFKLLHANPKQLIDGDLTLRINSLSFLKELDPLISNAEGQLQAKLTLTGTLSKPTIEGDVSLVNGALSLPKLGFNVKPVQLSLQSHDHQWNAKGTLLANGNAIALDGKGEFSPKVKGLLSLNADNFPLISTNDYVISISPKLTLEFAPALLKLRGNIVIPKAQIKPQTFTNTISLSDDAVFVSDQTPDNPLNMDTDVKIEMGSEVTLAVQGLQGFLGGAIQLKQLPKGPLTATGELAIRDGQYKAYGQDLIIDEGKLLFTGGVVDNPALQVRAIRKFDNATNKFAGSNQLFDFNAANMPTMDFGRKTTVGIEVSGRLNTPKVQLFSIPSNLSQADILSMLLLGKPASQASKSGGQLLLTAVSALNLNAGNSGMQLLSQLKQNLGIDFNLENNTQYNQKTNQTTESTAFVVGKALSKRLYLSYNMGLSQTDSNVLTLKYLLNKFFSVQVNASMTASGIDLLYTHQKE